MDKETDRMHRSVEEWTKKAEDEAAGRDSAPQTSGFTVKIPDEEFGAEEDISEEVRPPRRRTIVPAWENNEPDELPEKKQEREEPVREEGDDKEDLLAGIAAQRPALVAGALLAAALTVLELLPPMNRHLFSAIDWQTHPRAYVLLNLVLLAAAGFFFRRDLWRGFKRFFTLTASGDSLCALSFAGTFISACYFAFAAQAVAAGGACLYCAVSAVCLFFNGWGRYLGLARTRDNLHFIEQNDTVQAASLMTDDDDIEAVAGGLNVLPRGVMQTHRAVCLKDYLENAAYPTSFDTASVICAPVLFLIAVILFTAYYFPLGKPQLAFGMLGIVLSVGAPLLGALNPQFPLWRACRTLRRRGAMLTGYKTVLDYSGVEAAILDARALYPKGSIEMRGIKTYMGEKIDDVILDAASVASELGGTLADVFMQIIGNRTDVLRVVRDAHYEDFNGLCGTVGGKQVLVGTREMMARHGVSVPSRATEAKYLSDGWDILYIAQEGAVCALLILGYNASERTVQGLWRLQGLDVSLLMTTTDPNITSAMLSEEIDLDGRKLKVLSTSETEYAKHSAGECAAEAALAFTEQADGAGAQVTSVAAAVAACIRLKGTSRALTLLQVLGAFLGILFMLYASSMASSGLVGVASVLLYQLIWSLPVLLVFLRKSI